MARLLKIGIIGGAGWLAQTIIKALLHRGVLSERDIGVSYRSKPPAFFLPALSTTNSQDLIDVCETIILSVRPADFINLNINASGKLVVSMMAGISLEQLMRSSQASRVVRAMPNVAASVGHSYTPWVASANLLKGDREITTRVFEACGICDEVESEKELDYLTGFSGSGPAFPALLVEAMRKDAISYGLSPHIAQRAVTALLIGTGKLLEAQPKNTEDIVHEFLAYRGVIAASIEAMRQAGFDEAISTGLKAGRKRIQSISAPC